ncbi:4-oxalocrotonate tautomerase family protein [Desulfovibrio subterraneus]|uniref:4-oxalocrotonate tautomerase DmpI n=1 Tax=Desulfovibrio subterraneus TaxID=2718620 RepID=UPI0022B8D9D4|nr:4-oxalocrotonate tautomerase DmpI [Desulfovibrio subterraneus]WBF68531.1 4-oxalocrotonate tautomerase family protein [Desulfovibrio subterraneus]
MPIVTIVSNPLDVEQKRELVREITETCSRVMSLPPQTIVVILDEKQAENIGVAGTLLADRAA